MPAKSAIFLSCSAGIFANNQGLILVWVGASVKFHGTKDRN